MTYRRISGAYDGFPWSLWTLEVLMKLPGKQLAPNEPWLLVKMSIN